jgi:hypothetical protein
MSESRLVKCAVLTGALAIGAPAIAQPHAAAGTPAAPGAAAAEAAGVVEAAPFFDALVARYRGLSSYEDVADVAEVRTREGRPPARVETRITCRLEGDALSVTTPGTRARADAGLDVPVDASPALEALVLRYNLWLAPHMALHFAEDPLKDLRLGVPEGFTVTGAETVTGEEKSLVHLELESAAPATQNPAETGAAAPEAEPEPTARFEFWVDPRSMLIERIEGRQRLPDGADYETTLQITPVRADGPVGSPAA